MVAGWADGSGFDFSVCGDGRHEELVRFFYEWDAEDRGLGGWLFDGIVLAGCHVLSTTEFITVVPCFAWQNG